MTDGQVTQEKKTAVVNGRSNTFRLRLAELDPGQVAVWRAMSPAQLLEVAFQAYQFTLDAVRATERERHPDLPPDKLARRVTRRMQGDPSLGR